MKISQPLFVALLWNSIACITTDYRGALPSPLIQILLPPLPIQLINHLLPARQHFQRPTLIIMIPCLRDQPIRRDRARNHERAHHLQHLSEVLLLPVVLALGVVGEEDLHEPGPQFAGGGGDAVACAAVAGGEDFGGDLEACQVD